VSPNMTGGEWVGKNATLSLLLVISLVMVKKAFVTRGGGEEEKCQIGGGVP
jgi:hypothetical protein